MDNFKFQFQNFNSTARPPPPNFSRPKAKPSIYPVSPGSVFCLAPTEESRFVLERRAYRRARAQARVGLGNSLNKIIPAENCFDGLDWRWLADQVERSPKNLPPPPANSPRAMQRPCSFDLLAETEAGKIYPRVVEWTPLDLSAASTLVPPGHWLLLEDSAPIPRHHVKIGGNAECGMRSENVPASTPIHRLGDRHIASFAPRDIAGGG